MASSSSPARRVVRLHIWGAHPSSIPTLDPSSLYAASLLHATFPLSDEVTVQLASASTSLPRVPLLQSILPDSTSELIDDIEAIRTYCLASGLDSSFASDPEKTAKATALHALLDDQMLDLTLHSLFSLPANFRAVTAPAYSAVGGASEVSSSLLARLVSLPMRFQPSIPARLRNAVETHLTAAGLWGLGGKEASKRDRESDDLAARAGIVPTQKRGLGSSAKEAVRDEFERSKLITRAREVLEVFEAIVPSGSGAYQLGSEKASSLDAKLFAYLAPLLFSKPALPIDTLPKLITSIYPRLTSYIEFLRTKFFPAEAFDWATQSELASTPPTTAASSAGGSWMSYVLPGSINPTSTSTGTGSGSGKASFTSASSPPPSNTKRSSSPPKEELRLRLGRALWICSALVGLVGYTFASGIVSVKFVSPDEEEHDDEDDEDDEDEDDDDEEEVEGEWEVADGEELDDDLDEEEYEEG